MLKQFYLYALVGTLPCTIASALTLNVVATDQFTACDLQKLSTATNVINSILNSDELKNRILNFSYRGKLKFANNEGLSNQQIYDLLMTGAEVYPTETDANGKADVSLAIYTPPWYRSKKGIAFTSTDDSFLYLYRRYFTNASIAELSNTIIHEWTHKMGFDHDYFSTRRRPYSVPYGVGGIIEDMVTEANPLNASEWNCDEESDPADLSDTVTDDAF